VSWTPPWRASWAGETGDPGDDVPGTLAAKASVTGMSVRKCRSCAYTNPTATLASSFTYYKTQWTSQPTAFDIWTQR